LCWTERRRGRRRAAAARVRRNISSRPQLIPLLAVLTGTSVLEQIARYDAADAAALCARVQNGASLSGIVERWESIYHEVLANFDPAQIGRAEESWMTSIYLSRWHYYQRREWERAQLLRLKKVPVLGSALCAGVVRARRRWVPYNAQW
jgi:hypothetical protein